MPKPEQLILNSIMEYLAVKRIWHTRFNTGAIKLDKRFFRFGLVGAADVLCTLQNKRIISANYDTSHEIFVLWLEVKAPKGKQSEAQIKFMDEVRMEGHFYAVVRSIEDVEAVIKEIQ